MNRRAPPPSVHSILKKMLKKAHQVHLNILYRYFYSILSACIVVALITGYVTDYWNAGIVWLFVLAGTGGVLAVRRIARKNAATIQDILRQVGDEHPDMRYLLSTAAEQKANKEGEFSYLQIKVIKDAARKAMAKRLAYDFSAKALSSTHRQRTLVGTAAGAGMLWLILASFMGL